MTEEHPTYTPPPITGYRTLTQEEVDAVNYLKELEAKVLSAWHKLRMGDTCDPRWLATGKTDIEKGFMCLNRAIMKPEPPDYDHEIFNTVAQARAAGRDGY